MTKLKTNDAENLFSVRHLFFDYLPKRIGLFVVPLGVAVVLLVESPSKKLLFLLFVAVLGVVQVSNYYYCRGQHRELLAEFGERYRSRLVAELERVGLNALISRFWTGLKPD
jgi:putative effector of murein hydrolase LrgA (UPF0299 family)